MPKLTANVLRKIGDLPLSSRQRRVALQRFVATGQLPAKSRKRRRKVSGLRALLPEALRECILSEIALENALATGKMMHRINSLPDRRPK